MSAKPKLSAERRTLLISELWDEYKRLTLDGKAVGEVLCKICDLEWEEAEEEGLIATLDSLEPEDRLEPED